MAESRVKLVIDSQEFDAKLKTASQNLQAYFDKVKEGGGSFEHLDDGVMDCAKALGELATKAKSTKGGISELTASFTEWSMRYKQMTDAEKNTPFGKQIKNSLDQLKTRILDTKNDLASINQELSGSKFGQFGGIIDGIGRKMGINANLTELLTSKTALMTAGIGAAVAAIYKGTEAWAKYNAELSKQDQQTQVITGLKGSGADHMTDVMRALSDTYKVDFRQAVEAANTLMSQFGVSGSEAIQLIKDGMQGMIQGDGPKLLSMIQQYAPSFRDAGVSASQLVAVIHNSEGGIFTDQNMSAIVMGMKNIRLMTKQTSEALAKLGIDGNQMSQQLSNGSLTVFDALKQVASELKNVDSNSKTAGEVMQTVFGRQGAMAGTNLATAIETLNTNLEETKNQTGELGDAFADLQTANEKLNTVIRDAFSYDGWEQMATGIKAKLVDALADVLEKLADIKGYLMGFNANQILKNVYGDGVVPEKIQKDLDALKNAPKEKREELYKQQLAGYERRFQTAASSPELKKAEALYHADDNGNLLQKYNPLALIGKYYSSTQVNTERAKIEAEKLALEAYKKAAQQIMSPEPEKHTPGTNKSGTNKPSTPKTETQQNEAAIAKLTEEYQNLATAAKTADDAQKAGLAERMTAIQGEIKTLQDRNAELKKFADEAKGVKVSVGAEGSLPQLTQQLKDLQQAQGQSLDTREWVEYQKQIDVTSTKIDILKGKWKEGQVATFKVDAEAYDKLKELQDLTIEDGTITVKADTAEAYNKVQELISGIDGTTVSFDVKPQAKALPTLDDYRIQAMTALDTQNTKVDTNTLQTLLKDAMEKGIDTTSLNLEPIAEQIGKGIDVPDSAWEGVFDGYEELCEKIGADPIKINLKTGDKEDGEAKKVKNDWKDAAGAVQSLGAALQGIEDPAAKVMGIVAQAIATVALTFSKSLAGAIGPWDWIAAAAAGTATMISTITAIKSETKGGFAEGGIVPGNSFSGDNLRLSDYGVNSGELILNRAQQNNIADQLRERDSGGSMSGGLPYVTGEKIVLGINNWGRSKGYGQLVFSNR